MFYFENSDFQFVQKWFKIHLQYLLTFVKKAICFTEIKLDTSQLTGLTVFHGRVCSLCIFSPNRHF
jgi:hypothetical protein